MTRFSAKGLPFTTASCARRTLAAATSFMASVIFCVFFTELMRALRAFRPALCTCAGGGWSAPGHGPPGCTPGATGTPHLQLAALGAAAGPAGAGEAGQIAGPPAAGLAVGQGVQHASHDARRALCLRPRKVAKAESRQGTTQAPAWGARGRWGHLQACPPGAGRLISLLAAEAPEAAPSACHIRRGAVAGHSLWRQAAACAAKWPCPPLA